MKPLTDLPNEIVVLVGEQLSIKDLAIARQTSKYLNQLWSRIFFRRGCTHVLSGMMGLEWAVSRNREIIVRRMLETRPDMSIIRNSAGFTPLHLAVDQGMVDMVKLLLNAEADISLQSKRRDTPLHRAAKNGNMEVVQILLDSISSPETKTSILNTRNTDGNSPTMVAARSFHRPIVDLLISHGADTTIQKEQGSTILHTACELGFPSETRKLLQTKSIELNSRDNSENTPLHLAARSRCVDSVKLLLEAGANVSSQNYREETPLHLAASTPCAEIVKLLLDAGADVEAEGGNGDRPLHHAVIDTVKVLLEAGADIHTETMDGLSLMALACEEGNKELIRVLIAAGAEPPDWDWDSEAEVVSPPDRFSWDSRIGEGSQE